MLIALVASTVFTHCASGLFEYEILMNLHVFAVEYIFILFGYVFTFFFRVDGGGYGREHDSGDLQQEIP